MPRQQVNFRIGADKREKWQNHVDQNPDYDKLSDLIKIAVRNQIERDGSDAGEFDIPEPDVSGAQSGEVLDKLEALRTEITQLDTDVSEAVDAIHAQEGVDPDANTDVFKALPTDESEALTAREVAHATGYPEATVRFALENMRRGGVGVKNVVEVEDRDGNVETAVNVDAYPSGEVKGGAAAHVVGEPRWFRGE